VDLRLAVYHYRRGRRDQSDGYPLLTGFELSC